MLNIRFRFKPIHYSICLGLLVLVLVVTPARAKLPVLPSSPPPQGVLLAQSEPFPLLEQGRNFYEGGRFTEAIALWQQAANLTSNPVQRALILSYLSNAYQELGQWQEAETAIQESLRLLQAQGDRAVLAQVLNTQGSLQLAKGQTEAAFETWKQAEAAYIASGDRVGQWGSIMNQAQALQALGLYRRAKTTLEQLNAQLQTLPDFPLKVSGLRSLGVTLQVVGDLAESQQVLEQSLAIAQRLNLGAEMNASLFSLANTLRALNQPQAALEAYQTVAQTATHPLTQVQAQLNQLSLLAETEPTAISQPLITQLQDNLGKLPPSRAAIYSQINFARTLLQLQQPVDKIQTILSQATAQARQLQDARAESYAIGQQGYLSQQMQQWPLAEQQTQQALAIAQTSHADNLIARWQGQLGQIWQQQGKLAQATVAYGEAVKILQSLRQDLVAINPEVQFSFRDNVEPIYRQLVGLLLNENSTQAQLRQAREVIESLQLAELDNFFREACVDIQPQSIEQLDPQAAVIYPIILPDRLAAILSLPGKPLSYYAVPGTAAEIEQTFEQFLESLNRFFSNSERLRLAQQIYQWLIQPIQAELIANHTQTLVFVLDGTLRNLPMAALHDGQQYLIEKYQIAIAPGLKLLVPANLSLSPQPTKMLAGGLTQARQGFAALPAVEAEIAQITTQIPAQVFLDREFTETRLQHQLQHASFEIVHLATHGQFSSKADSTFILAWDRKIPVKRFEEILRFRQQTNPNPIELLVLSACQTATGDKQAALGLAGVAVRSGARSTLATLWSVQDASTAEFMSEFYHNLLRQNTKAEALRQAQLAMIKQPRYAHPYYWAPFILVGNWL
ncbi:CHAT domain-containing protein [Geitlerinema splendidum]|nr:CHAT domain-containing protein [Geitlerinema splendidum]